MDPVRLEADEILQCIKKLPDTIRDVERLAQRVPSDVDFHFFSNFQEFKAPIRGMQAQVESLLNEIGMAKELRPQVAAWPNDPDETYDWLVGVQDDLVEGIDTALDQFELEKRAQKKGKSKSEPEKTMQVQTVMQQQSSDGFTEVVKLSKPRKQVNEGRSIPFHIRSIPRPQDKFDIAPDNSNTPFKHPCSLNNSEKKNGGASTVDLHARKLGVRNSLDDYHPLKEELIKMEYVEGALEAGVPQEPRPLAETPLTVVSALSALTDMAAKLRAAGEIAVDLEHHHYRSFQGFICVMQVSTRLEDFIVDTLELRTHIGPCLADIFASSSIKKVMHGADHDILWLQRDFGIYVCNLFDTGQAARVLQLEGFGLAFLLQHFLDIHPDKRYQLADWRIRPLPSEMIKYAREDTHYLLYLHDLLKVQLASASPDKNDAILQVYKRSRDICLQLYQKEIFTETSYLNLYGLEDKGLQPNQMAVLAGLYAWRDRVARKEDESTGYVLPNQLLFRLAEETPDTSKKLHTLIRGSHSLVGDNIASVLEVIRHSKEQAAFVAPVTTVSQLDKMSPLEAHTSERVRHIPVTEMSDPVANMVDHPIKAASDQAVSFDHVKDDQTLNSASVDVSSASETKQQGDASVEADIVDKEAHSQTTTGLPFHPEEILAVGKVNSATIETPSSSKLDQPVSSTVAIELPPVSQKAGNREAKLVHARAKPSSAFGALLGSSARNKVQARSSEDIELVEARLKAEKIRASVVLPFNRIPVTDVQENESSAVDHVNDERTLSQDEVSVGKVVPELPASGEDLPEVWGDIVFLEKGNQKDPSPATKVPKTDGINAIAEALGVHEGKVPSSLSEMRHKSQLHREKLFEKGFTHAAAEGSSGARKEQMPRVEQQQRHSKKQRRSAKQHNQEGLSIGESTIIPFDYKAARQAMGLEGTLGIRGLETQKPKAEERRIGKASKRQRQAPPPSGGTGTKKAFDPLRAVREDPRPEGISAPKRRQVFPQSGNRTSTFRH
ncbi:hypothetical protein CY35_18G022400 [Sphagnum magellanicum]|nr:hypothetical protein CY35_18G022400 [Sphagnum magellanicum]